MNLYNKIKSDIKNNPNLKGRIIVVSYTITNFFRKRVNNKFKLILCAPIIILYKLLTDIILGCEIPASTIIGEGFIIHHGRAIVLNKHVVIGKNVTVKHNTTIGNKLSLDGKDLGSPIIKDNVLIEPHSIIIGPITIGKNSIIGAGSVVVKSIEPFSIVAGNPAKLIRKIDSNIIQ
jgi:putative colanic acid biosynthesis acetyltransferase WcaB